MTWQSLASVMDDASTREADDFARYAPIRTTGPTKGGLLACPAPGCNAWFERQYLGAHFADIHDREGAANTARSETRLQRDAG